MSDRPNTLEPPETIQRPEAPDEIQEADETEVSAEPETEPVTAPDQDDVGPDEKRYACLAYRADPEQPVETRYAQHAMAAAEGFLRWEIKSQTSNLRRDPETGERFAGAEAEMAWAVTKDGQEFLIVEAEMDNEDDEEGEWTHGELWSTFTAREVAECRQTWKELKEPIR